MWNNDRLSLLMVALITLSLEGVSTLLKSEYNVTRSKMDYDSAKTSCAPGHLVDLRTDQRDSLVHQLLPFFNAGKLDKSEKMWIGLEREFPGGQFRWYDNEIQADLNMGSFTYKSIGAYDDDNDCVATKKKSTDDFIIRIEPCSTDEFPFCQIETGEACDYEMLGNLYPTTAGDNSLKAVTETNRLDCETRCTNWIDTHPNECWLYAFNSVSQSCRLIHGVKMPHWNDTCDWFVYDSDWKTWKRNCFDVKVYDENGAEIILGPCVYPTPTYVIEEVSSTLIETSGFIETSQPDMMTQPDMTSQPDMTGFITVSSEVPVETSINMESSSMPDRITSSVVDLSISDSILSSVGYVSISDSIPPSVADMSVSDLMPSSVADVSLSDSVPPVGYVSMSDSMPYSVADMSVSNLMPSSVADVSVSDSVPSSVGYSSISDSIAPSVDYVSTPDLMPSSVADMSMSDLSSPSAVHMPLSSGISVTSFLDDQLMSSLDVNDISVSSVPGQFMATSVDSVTGVFHTDQSSSALLGSLLEQSQASSKLTVETSVDSWTVQSTEIEVTPVQTLVQKTTLLITTQGEIPTSTTGSTDDRWTASTGDIDGLCEMVCPCNSTQDRRTDDAFIIDILNSLSIDRTNTSAYRRQHISAYDDRPLAVGIGWTGASVLICVGLGIFLLDCKRLFHDIGTLFSNVKELLRCQ